MWFIYGQEQYLIDKKVLSIIKKQNMLVNIYDEDADVEDIIMDISTIGMFSQTKHIIIKNHQILIKEKEGDKLIKVLQNVDQTILITFSLVVEYLNPKVKLIKYLLKYANCKKFTKLDSNQVVPIIKEIVTKKGGIISNEAAIKFAIKIPHNFRIIIQELEKLLMESNEITSQMIDISIGNYLKSNYFDLSNALCSSDPHSIWDAYRKKKMNGDSATIIIEQIAKLFNLAIIVNAYKKQGLVLEDIAKIMQIHQFRIKKSLELIAQSSIEHISNFVIDLAKLDKNIKMGKIDKDKGLDYFFLQLIKDM